MSSEDMRAKISLREQADAAHRELAMRHRVYPGLVKRGKLTEVEAEVGYAEMRAIRDTLRLFAEFEDPLRVWLQQQVATRRLFPDLPAGISDAERDSLTIIVEQFPGAVLADVRERDPAPSAADPGLPSPDTHDTEEAA